MNWLKFYYFTFLYYYKKKGENWTPSFRAVLLVELTAMSLISLTVLLIDPSFFTGTSKTIGRLYWLVFNVVLFVVFYQILARKTKSSRIYEMFIKHKWNTKTNRMLCWLIWAISFLAPFVLVIVHKQLN